MQKKQLNKVNRDTSLYCKGESLVCHVLKAEGYVILKQNFRKIGCEIDIIAKKGDEIVIVEVKTRTQGHCGNLGYDLENILPTKKKRALIRGTLHYLAESDLEYASIRIDLVLALYDPNSDTFALKHYPDIGITE